MSDAGKLEDQLKVKIGALKDFQGFQEDFDEVYEEGRKVLAEMLRGNPILPPSIATIEREFHQTALEARKRMRERIKQMDRAALLQHNQTKLMQRRAAKASGGEDEVDSMANDITASLQRMSRTMQEENDKAILSHQILERSTRKLQGTNEKYEEFSGVLGNTSGAIKGLWKRERYDKFWIGMALLAFLLAALHIVFARIWVPPMWLVTVPAKWVMDKWHEMSKPVVKMVVEHEMTPKAKEIDLSVEPVEEIHVTATQSETIVGTTEALKETEEAIVVESEPTIEEPVVLEQTIDESIVVVEPITISDVTDTQEQHTEPEKVAETILEETSIVPEVIETQHHDTISIAEPDNIKETSVEVGNEESQISESHAESTIEAAHVEPTEEKIVVSTLEVTTQETHVVDSEIAATEELTTAEIINKPTESPESLTTGNAVVETLDAKTQESKHETIAEPKNVDEAAVTNEVDALVEPEVVLESAKVHVDDAEETFPKAEVAAGNEAEVVIQPETVIEPEQVHVEEPLPGTNVDNTQAVAVDMEPLDEGEILTGSQSYFDEEENIGYSEFFNSSDFNSEDIEMGNAFGLGSISQESGEMPNEQDSEEPVVGEEPITKEAVPEAPVTIESITKETAAKIDEVDKQEL